MKETATKETSASAAASSHKLIIIGGGPAGITAAIYAARAGINTLVLAKDGGALGRVSKIENYYGFPQPISGADLLQNGHTQASNLGVEIRSAEVVNLSYGEQLLVKTTQEELAADAVVLATGSARQTPKIPGLERFEGKGVSYCAVCDGFFFRNKPVAVLGNASYALSEVHELLPLAQSVTLLTNGQQLEVDFPPEVNVVQQEIAEFCGGKGLQCVQLKDGSQLDIAGLFIAVGVAGSADLAKKVGAMTEGNRILINQDMSTNVPGLFAAGDCTGGLLQIAKAVYQGCCAGSEATKYLRKLGSQA